ncbi:hypothetical protein R6Q57_003319 [Mikania cordata]
MSFWDERFFNYYVPDLNEEPPVEYSYGTIDLNVEPNADVDFDTQASAHQGAVREQEDEELSPDIEFSLCGQHMEMSIERSTVLLGLYYEPETIRDAFI